MLHKIMLVFIGGGLGAAARELLILYVHGKTDGIPLSLLIANQTACFFIGLISGLSKKERVLIDRNEHLFAIVGFMGGLSSFSSLIFGSLSMMKEAGALLPALLYLGLNMILGFVMAAFGLDAGRFFRKHFDRHTPPSSLR